MDSYEAFFFFYFDFMTKYSKSSDTAAMMVDYAEYMTKYADYMSKLDAWDSEEMNPAEEAYYAEVHARILKKIAEIPEVSEAMQETSQAAEDAMSEISDSVASMLDGLGI